MCQAIAAVKQILLKTLKDLNHKEREQFKWLLQFTYFQKGLPHVSWRHTTNTAYDLVDLMLETCGQQCVETTREVLMEMNRRDLAERLSETSSSGSKGQRKKIQLPIHNQMGLIDV